MKKLCMLTVLFLALTCAIVCCSAGVTPLTFFAALRSSALAAAAPQDATRTSDSPSSAAPSMQTQTRGVWVATAYSIDYPAQPTTDADTLRAECRTALDRIAASGANTVYFQVRPSCDALYRSQLFPWSRYLTGTCGTAPSDSFDPLAYWVEQAHARNLRLEAWVNPYRICAGANAQSDFDALPPSSIRTGWSHVTAAIISTPASQRFASSSVTACRRLSANTPWTASNSTIIFIRPHSLTMPRPIRRPAAICRSRTGGATMSISLCRR